MTILNTALTSAQKATKAIYAALVAGISGLILVTIDNPIDVVTQNQWLVIGLSVMLAGGGVYGLSNKT